MNRTIAKLIKILALRAHPIENGYYNEVYMSPLKCTVDNKQFSLMSSDLFLYEHGDFAPWHRMLHCDELWVHQQGGPSIIHMLSKINSNWSYNNSWLTQGKTVHIPSKSWFSVEIRAETEGFMLSNNILAPGFEDDDMEMMQRDNNILKEVKNFPDGFDPTVFLK